ncbi:winged helix DNA-binding domain-containing protein [Actinacidiphila paucisporea]|uniref:Winged helix DNA-binding domain-containing protein n=1 Tax=Actinacidiphila paucisporea TaxID=310782 RepID=A0A1M7E8W6_9ACTN|nr:winged helix DNA-binding domain-containing protein [Actinacidiphila paucisporea]SHL88096.1 Winged helix DNA-binding domain-containing protein [Actinacidiphila paucisporea]
MTDDDTVRLLRARAQALAGGVREASAEAVVRRVFAVQAQDATAADLGIRARARDLTRQAVRAAYDDERSIVRGWFMRGTLHTVHAEDVHWLLRLLSPRTLAAGRRRYQQLGLDEDLRERSDRLIERALSTHGPLTRAELTDRLTALGVPPEGQAPFHLIRHAALTGVLCHGPHRAGEPTYALLADWLPTPTTPDRDAPTALAELARRYLAAHAPATAQDFATWSGLPITAVRTAWKSLPDPGHLEPPPPAPTDVRLIPAYDDYHLSHSTQPLSVPAAHRPHIWPGGGVIRPTALANGLTFATWTRTPVQLHPFTPVPPDLQPSLDQEVAAVTHFLTPTPPPGAKPG